MSCWLTYHYITSSPVSLRHEPACVCFAVHIPLPEEVARDVCPRRAKFVFSFMSRPQVWDWRRQRKSGGSPRVLKIGPKRGEFCGTNSLCILLAAVGSAVWLDNSAEGRHCCIPASTLKSSVLLTSVSSNRKRRCWISIATVVTWSGHGDKLHVCDCRLLTVQGLWRCSFREEGMGSGSHGEC